MIKTSAIRTTLRILSIAIALAIVCGLFFIWDLTRLEPYGRFTRPDGAYYVEILRRPILFGTMPGQASDAPGVAQLRDRNDNLLAEVRLEMVQLASEVYWQDNHAYIPLIADWDLQALQSTR